MNERDYVLAKQAGFVLFDDYTDGLKKTIELFAAAIRADERDACAKVCEDDESGRDSGGFYADLIRARGNK